MKLCANLSMLFTELPMAERISAARIAGFDGVEILFPYDDPAPDLLRLLQQNQMPLALINAPPPNYTGAARGFAAVPEAEPRFARDLRRALRYAEHLGAERIHLMAGAAEGPEARACFERNLRLAAETAPQQIFTIEPINRVDMPGYFLADFDLAAEILTTLDLPNLRLQFDAYHAQRITEDVPGTWARVRHLVDHVQVSDAPGRGAPGSGQIDYAGFWQMLRDDGYDGWISAEYAPGGDTGKTLGWMETARAGG